MAICVAALVCLFYGLLPNEPAKPDSSKQAGTSPVNSFNPFTEIEERITELKKSHPEDKKGECNLAIWQLAVQPASLDKAMQQGQWLKDNKCAVNLAFRIDHSEQSQHALGATSIEQHKPQTKKVVEPPKQSTPGAEPRPAATPTPTPPAEKEKKELGAKPTGNVTHNPQTSAAISNAKSPEQSKPTEQKAAEVKDKVKREHSTHLVGSTNWLTPLAEAAIRAELFREYAYQHAVEMAKHAKDAAEQDKKADDNKRDKFKTMLAAVLAVVFLIPLAIACWRFLGYIIGDTHWLTGFHESVAKSGESGADSKEGKKDGGPSWLAMIPVITLSGATAIGAYHALGPGIGALPPANLTMPDSNLLNQLNQLNNLKALEPDTSKFPGNDLKVIADAMLEQGRQQATAIRELGNKQAEAAKTYAEAQTKTTQDLANALKELASQNKTTSESINKSAQEAEKVNRAIVAQAQMFSDMGVQHQVDIKALDVSTVKSEQGLDSVPKLLIMSTDSLAVCLKKDGQAPKAFIECIQKKP